MHTGPHNQQEPPDDQRCQCHRARSLTSVSRRDMPGRWANYKCNCAPHRTQITRTVLSIEMPACVTLCVCECVCHRRLRTIINQLAMQQHQAAQHLPTLSRTYTHTRGSVHFANKQSITPRTTRGSQITTPWLPPPSPPSSRLLLRVIINLREECVSESKYARGCALCAEPHTHTHKKCPQPNRTRHAAARRHDVSVCGFFCTAYAYTIYDFRFNEFKSKLFIRCAHDQMCACVNVAV